METPCLLVPIGQESTFWKPYFASEREKLCDEGLSIQSGPHPAGGLCNAVKTRWDDAAEPAQRAANGNEPCTMMLWLSPWA
jgi:hypothetical protein